MESYPAELRFLRLTAVDSSSRVSQGTPLAFRPPWSPQGREDGRDSCPKGAGDLRGPRSAVRGGDKQRRREAVASRHHRSSSPTEARIDFPSQMQGAALSTVNKVVPPVNELVHVVGRGDAQRGAYRREGDGAHRRGGRGRGSLCASSLLPSHDRDEECSGIEQAFELSPWRDVSLLHEARSRSTTRHDHELQGRTPLIGRGTITVTFMGGWETTEDQDPHHRAPITPWREGEDGRDLCPKGAGDLRGPRSAVRGGDKQRRREAVASRHHRSSSPTEARIDFPSQMQGAALSTVNKVVPPVNELVHVVGRGDAQRGAYRREGDGAHRRGGRGRGSLCASSLLPSHDARRDEEVNLPDPVRGR
ncbi:hypothetical protein THAOC_15246 [Thalassiosira oceanica]|uniref:Uncharacterized protein n=1 Tax=Thalassiosira oceanica TaxID=159749 RepID=K0T0Q5_THAOC|nr:hypothetical protein THAOC_15246 [Thalassiosira oceanica]|eukprot:EJK64057.1 hypothetical protein THAOC_15246 [Thalassiosira oceanica]